MSQRLLLALLWGLLAILCIAFFFTATSPEQDESSPISRGNTGVVEDNRQAEPEEVQATFVRERIEGPESVDSSSPDEANIEAPARTISTFGELIAESSCQMLVKTQGQESFFILTSLEADGARYLALDERGVIAGGQLAWRPSRISVGLPEFGEPLIAFSLPREEEDGGHQLRIHRGSGEIFSSEAVMEYGIARNGGSYFVVELLAADSARLRVRNFYEGSETQFDLDAFYKRDEDGRFPFHAGYSVDEREIIFASTSESLRKRHHFFPVGDEGRRRRVVVQLHTKSSQALFASSNVLYIASIHEDGRHALVTKYTADPRAPWSLTEEWTTPLYPSEFTGQLSLTEDGAYLIAHAELMPGVLETSTGQPLFAAPIWNDIMREALGEEGLSALVKFHRQSTDTPHTDIVWRENMHEGGGLVALVEIPQEPPVEMSELRPMKLLDLGALWMTNRREETYAESYPVPCRFADPPFAGVAKEFAEYPLTDLW